MEITQKTKEIVDKLYAAYGSYSGHLFGIKPEHRHSVEVIVQFALDNQVESEVPAEDEDL